VNLVGSAQPGERAVLRLAVDLAQRAVRGEAFEDLLVAETARLFDADAGAGLTFWNGSLEDPMGFRVCTSPGVALPVAQAVRAARYAREHPGFAAMARWGTGAPVRVSDTVRIAEFWDTEAYQHMHGFAEGRYPASAVFHAGPRSLVFLGLHRRSRDFSDGDLEALALLQQPLARAISYRLAVEATLVRLSELEGPGRRQSDAPTHREAEVLAMVAGGLTNEQIGRRLGITERTVRKHLGAVCDKTGLRSRAAAAAWWQRRQDQGGVS
jgi:DNA-binding CsgD family transcriptional regulator